MRDNLVVHDRQGNLMARHRLFVPGAWIMYVRDVVVSDDGDLAAAGSVVSKEGKLSGYLAILSRQRPTVRVVQLGAFSASNLKYAPDGTLWVLGVEPGEERKMSKASPHSILRQYSGDGVLLSEHLRWPDLVDCGGRNPVADSPSLATRANSVAVLLPVCDVLWEISTDGQVLGHYPLRVAGFDGVEATWTYLPGLAMTAEGGVYCHIRGSVLEGEEKRIVEGLYKYDREEGLWRPVEMQAALASTGKLGWLAGLDGESFVYGASNHTWVWLNIVKQ
jgi:hypothetical protein